MSLILETPRLLLRHTEMRDAETFVRELNNYNIVRNTARVPYPYHHSDALEFLQFAKSVNDRSCVAAVELKSQPGTLVGVFSYEWSEGQQDAELGYWLSEQVWGQGFGTEAASAMVHHAFEINDHPKLVACYHNENPASGRILTKLGFVSIGSCDHFSKAQGKEVTVKNMQMLREQWRNKKAAF